MKRLLSLLLLLSLCLTMCGCSLSNRDYYERAQLFLGSGDFANAAQLFSQLGEYEDSADYALYCAALLALQEGELELARANLTQLAPFKSSGRYLRLLQAMTLERSGDLEGALLLYDALGSFENSAGAAQRLRAAIPEKKLEHASALMDAGRYEQALAELEAMDGYGNSASLAQSCRQALTQAAYEQAEQLYGEGRYEEALAAFEALGDAMDAKARVLACRSAMYRSLEADYRTASLSTAESLIDRYAEMEDYLDSALRRKALESRFRTNLTLLSSAASSPYVRYGSYPALESGSPAPLTWRVIAAENGCVTLLCEQVIDAMSTEQADSLALTLTPEEQAGLVSLGLPREAQVSGLPALACDATPYAAAQGVYQGEGGAMWRLADTKGVDRSLVVWYNGTVIRGGLPCGDEAVGVRPVCVVSLEKYAFSQGDGSAADPFR